MSHLHIPDGVLPAALWLPGLVTAVLLILVSARSLRQESPQQVAYQGALGALVLAAFAAAAAVAQAVCGLLWMGLMTVGLRAHAWSGRPDGGGGGRFGVLALVGVPLWILGVAAETTVAFGIARFLARVRPDLLPAAKDT